MNQLTAEQMAEIEAHPEGGWFQGPNGQRVYFVRDGKDLRNHKAVDQMTDHEAIAAGIADLEAGRTKPLAEAMDGIRERLGFPKDS